MIFIGIISLISLIIIVCSFLIVIHKLEYSENLHSIWMLIIPISIVSNLICAIAWFIMPVQLKLSKEDGYNEGIKTQFEQIIVTDTIYKPKKYSNARNN